MQNVNNCGSLRNPLSRLRNLPVLRNPTLLNDDQKSHPASGDNCHSTFILRVGAISRREAPTDNVLHPRERREASACTEMIPLSWRWGI